jgi:AraC-like DNA-binding protein
MMKTALQNCQARMQRVLDYIEQHPNSDLDLETVSRIAAFSKFHFHREFTATFELSVRRYVQLVRLKRASHWLTDRKAESLTCGRFGDFGIFSFALPSPLHRLALRLREMRPANPHRR